MNKKHVIIGVFVFLVILVIGGVWCWQGKIVKEEKNGDGLVDAVPSTVENDNNANQNNQVEYDFSQDLDVSKWAVYESAKVGMRIKYPKDWEVVELENEKAGFALRSPGYVPIPIQSGKFYYDGEVYVNSITNPKSLSIDDLFQTFDDGSGLWFSQYQYEDMDIGGRKGVYFPEIDRDYHSGRESYFISGQKIMYSFDYIYPDQENPLISKILKEIVENFEPIK